MANTPVDLLFGAYRKRILAVLLLRANEAFHVRELSRLSGVPAGSLHRELKLLATAGLLLSEPMGNQLRYRANRDSIVYPELAQLFRKTVGLVDVLREALAPIMADVDLAFVFGSVAQGTETPASDVDLMMLGRASFAQVVAAVAPLRERLGREVNPVVMLKSEFTKKLAANDRFAVRVAAEPKLFVIGDADDFAKLAGDRPAETA